MFKKAWLRALFRRRIFVIFLLLLQVFLMVYTVYSSSLAHKWVGRGLTLISLSVLIHMIATSKRTSYKLIWAILILTIPLFGGLLYLLIQIQARTITAKPHLFHEEGLREKISAHNRSVQASVAKTLPAYETQWHLLANTYSFPAFYNALAEYLPSGEAKFSQMLKVLKQAQSFIFLEYFIINNGKMWRSVLEILKEKAAMGVDVRIIYDDMGCFTYLPLDYPKQLAKWGIRCVVFNKFRPILSTLQNNRDHRKIAVVDGKWAFTGGINLSDEYINATVRHGHWRDASIFIEGPAVDSFTLMFLDMWQGLTGEKDDLKRFTGEAKEPEDAADGYIIPYCDNPMDEFYVGEQVYMNLISGAQRYLYIETPYLILDDNFTAALILAAKKGVDVRILTPHVPDKVYVHMTTTSYYKELISGGVQIYEYTPGFVHAKVMVADDTVATVGTVNLDYRSLYLHFECGAWLLGCRTISEIKEDFLAVLPKCKPITLEDCKIGFLKSVFQKFFRLFAPLM